MKKTTLAGIGIILALIAVIGTGTFSFGDGETPCEFEKLEIEGETFNSLEEFRDRAEEEGLNLEKENVFQNFEFDEREDGLYYKSLDCGVEQINE